MKSTDKFVLVLVASLFLLIAGCGGGGGSSSPAMPPDDDMTMEPDPIECDDGYEPNAANDACVKTATTVAAEAKAEAERVAGMIGPTATLADYDGTTDGNQPIVSIGADGKPSFEGDPASMTSTDPRFTKSEDAPASIAESGWEGGTYTRTTRDGGVTNMDTVVKYNDKAPNTAQSYNVYFSGTNVSANTNMASVAVDNGEDATDGILSIAGGEIVGNHGLFTGDFGITGPHQTIPATPNDPDTTADESVKKIVGTFRGIPGTFECTGTACTQSSDKDGNLSALGGTWTFTPDGIKNQQGNVLTGTALTTAMTRIMVAGVVPDPDFMILGYWMRTSTAADGKVTHSMLPIHDGLRDYGDLTTGTGVVGTATYTGPATGLYTRNALTSEGTPTGPYSSGQFTADARLVANFGGGAVAANDQWSISGTVSNFMDGDTEISSAWVVNLNRMMLGTGAAATPQKNIYGSDPAVNGDGTTGTFGGVTHGGTLGSTAGAWSGLFHGADDATTTDVVEQPASVSGMFNANFSNGHVRGAFAANRQAQ